MYKIIGGLFLSFLATAISANAESVVNCADGSRYMKIETNSRGALVGNFMDFNLKLSNMHCKRIPTTINYHCDSSDYYVLVIMDSSGKPDQAQLNLQGGGDSY